MPVYVDKAANAYGRMKMAHMLADTLGELHEMADVVGLKRKWFQNKKIPHYDLCQAKREIAIKNGAIEIGNRQVVKLIKQWRNAPPRGRKRG